LPGSDQVLKAPPPCCCAKAAAAIHMQLDVKLSLATTDQTRHALPPAAMGGVAAASLLDKRAPQPPTPGDIPHRFRCCIIADKACLMRHPLTHLCMTENMAAMALLSRGFWELRRTQAWVARSGHQAKIWNERCCNREGFPVTARERQSNPIEARLPKVGVR
jgi:hypothetical protein